MTQIVGHKPDIWFSWSHCCIDVPLQKVLLTERNTSFSHLMTGSGKLKYMYVAAVCLGCQFSA